jgi:hypothetical protein
MNVIRRYDKMLWIWNIGSARPHPSMYTFGIYLNANPTTAFNEELDPN